MSFFPSDSRMLSIEDALAELEAIELVETDDQNLESEWHRLAINLLLSCIHVRFKDRSDFYASGNMFIYFNIEVARKRNFRGPDFFFVWGAPSLPLRPYWATWREGGRYPDVIMELLSPETRNEDLTSRKDVYEQTFRTSEYYCCDPYTGELFGWRLVHGRYQSITPNEHGRLWSDQLELWIGAWEGEYMTKRATWVRFYDRDGLVVPTDYEAACQRTQLAQTQANFVVERQRREVVEQELARLRALLAQQQSSPAANPGSSS